MSARSIGLSEELHDYLLNTVLDEPPLLARLRDETLTLPGAGMQISPEQGQFMRLLVQLLGVRRAIEVGTFTGYSAISMAMGLPRDGQLICCDLNPDTTAIARRYWQEAGQDRKIDLRLGPALETLDALIGRGNAGGFDFAFIDADKTNYDGYYERCLTLLRPGGCIAVDNMLWGGSVANPANNTEDTKAIRALNEKMASDDRVYAALVPIGDGMMLARKA